MSVPLYNHYKELNGDVLKEDEDFLDEAAAFLIEREGYKADELVSPDQIYDGFMEHFRYQNVNEVTALRDLTYAQEADDEQKARFGRLMDTYDRMDSDLGWSAAGDYLAGVFTAPSTYAGIFSFGAGKAGALAAQQGVKFGIRQALKTGGLRGGAVGMGVDASAAAATVTAQEAARVESGVKDEIDYTNVGLATGVSALTGGALGTVTGARKAKVGFEAEEIAMATRGLVDEATEKAHSTATKKAFKDKATKDTAKTFSKALFDDAEAAAEATEGAAKKLPLGKTIPKELEEGKALRGTIGGIEAKEIENIAAAAAKIDSAIPDLPDLPAGKVERFASRFARGINTGLIKPEDLQKILDDHAITIEQLGPMFAAELSRAGTILGTFGAAVSKNKRGAYKEAVTQLNELDDNLRMFGGTVTGKAREQLNGELTKSGWGRIGGVIQHINRARIGMMTIQPATTIRNTTNGYYRNYVYAFDNLGAGLVDVAKGSVKKLINPSDAELKKAGEIAVRKGVAQLRSGAQALMFDDLVFGMQSVKTASLFRLLQDPKFGKNEMVQKLIREMGDIGNLTGTEGGLIGAARFFNGLNTMSDNMFKRAIFSRELDKAIRSNPLKAVDKDGKSITINSLDEALRTGTFRNISDEEFSNAMEKAFDFTYQTGNFRSREGGFNKFAAAFIDFGQSTVGSTVVPFPRYLINQFRFAYEHAPILGMINTFGILNNPGKAGTKGIVDLSSEALGRQLGGLAMLGTFMGIRANYGDETTGPYEYKVDGQLYNAEASLGPFASYALLADMLYRYNPENWHSNDKVSRVLPFTTREMIQAFGGGNIRAGTSLDVLDGVVETLVNAENAGSTELEIQDAVARYFGNIANTFTVGAGALKDIMAQVDPEYRQVLDSSDVNMWRYFLKQAGRSLPTTVGEEDAKLESPTRTGGVRRLNPIIKQFTGLTPIENRTVVEDELKRLQFDYREVSPYRIKFDRSLSNEAKGIMGAYVEREIASYISNSDYQTLPSDVQKRFYLKKQLAKFRTLARNMVLDPEAPTTEEEFNRVMRARFLNLSKEKRKVLNDRYKTEFPTMYKGGILDDNAFWIMDY